MCLSPAPCLPAIEGQVLLQKNCQPSKSTGWGLGFKRSFQEHQDTRIR